MTTLNTVNQTNNNDQNFSYLAKLECHYLISLTPNLSLNRSNVIFDKPFVNVCKDVLTWTVLN